MLAMPERLNISHPLIASLHLRKDFGTAEPENVLVIKTSFPENDEDYESYDSYLMDLLLDLEEIKNESEKHVGKVDRVDIRTN